MAVCHAKRGTGITAGLVLTLGGSAEDIGDTLGAGGQLRSFENLTREVERQARAYLREIGVDPDNRAEAYSPKKKERSLLIRF